MKITHASIKNFRALKDIELDLHQFSIIIGENDSGKTSFFYALQYFFAQKKASEPTDWYGRNTDVPIEIVLTISNLPSSINEEWAKNDNVKIKAVFNLGEPPKYSAVLGEGDGVPITNAKIKNYFPADNLIFIPVNRGIGTEFSIGKTALLGKILRARMNKILEDDPGNHIRIIKDKLIKSMEEPRVKMEQFLREQLKNDDVELKFNEVTVDPVSGIEIHPTISDEKVQDIYVENRGAGTQNNTIISLFRYIAESNMGKDFIFLVEEPENSLHPKAQRHLLSVLQNISETAQMIITTHSPVFIDRSKYESNIIFTRTNSGNTVAKVFNKNPSPDVRDALGIRVSDALLNGGGNCALLVEGQTEKESFPIFMDMMGISEFQLGASIIDMGGKSNAEKIVRLLNNYGEIPCVVVFDKDGEKQAKDLQRLMDNNKKSNISKDGEKQAKDLQHLMDNDKKSNIRKVFCLSKGTIEDYYPTKIIVGVINRHHDSIQPPVTEKDFTSGSGVIKQVRRIFHERQGGDTDYFKVNLGRYGPQMMKDEGRPVPNEIQEILNEVKKISTEN